MYQQTKEQQQKYFTEVRLRLREAGFEVLDEGQVLPINYDGNPLCAVEPSGGVSYRSGNIDSPEAEEAKDKAFEISRTTAEYMRLMESAPFLKATGLEDKYKLLAEFNGTVFAGTESRFGVQFVTWERDFQGDGVCHGHYYKGSYTAAKQDFAVRAGLIDKELLFDKEQLIEIYRCCDDTLFAGYELRFEQEQCIKKIKEQIEDYIPDISEQIQEQDKKAEFAQNPEQSM